MQYENKEVWSEVRVKESIDGYEIKLTGKDANNASKTVTYLLPSNVNPNGVEPASTGLFAYAVLVAESYAL